MKASDSRKWIHLTADAIIFIFVRVCVHAHACVSRRVVRPCAHACMKQMQNHQCKSLKIHLPPPQRRKEGCAINKLTESCLTPPPSSLTCVHVCASECGEPGEGALWRRDQITHVVNASWDAAARSLLEYLQRCSCFYCCFLFYFPLFSPLLHLFFAFFYVFSLSPPFLILFPLPLFLPSSSLFFIFLLFPHFIFFPNSSAFIKTADLTQEHIFEWTDLYLSNRIYV